MEELYLDQNSFTGPLPTELGILTDLKILDLSFNELTGRLPSEFANFEQINRSECKG